MQICKLYLSRLRTAASASCSCCSGVRVPSCSNRRWRGISSPPPITRWRTTGQNSWAHRAKAGSKALPTAAAPALPFCFVGPESSASSQQLSDAAASQYEKQKETGAAKECSQSKGRLCQRYRTTITYRAGLECPSEYLPSYLHFSIM